MHNMIICTNNIKWQSGENNITKIQFLPYKKIKFISQTCDQMTCFIFISRLPFDVTSPMAQSTLLTMVESEAISLDELPIFEKHVTHFLHDCTLETLDTFNFDSIDSRSKFMDLVRNREIKISELMMRKGQLTLFAKLDVTGTFSFMIFFCHKYMSTRK